MSSSGGLSKQIHALLAKWVELKSSDKGDREAGFARRYLIYRLAKAAPEIVGKPATVAVTGTFADLCTSVALACGLPETGIAKAIPAAVRSCAQTRRNGAGDRNHDCRCFRPKI
jgi:hypothetical protein